jgi:hypothetical protein
MTNLSQLFFIVIKTKMSNKFTVFWYRLNALLWINIAFLGAFAKLRKATISFFMSACRMEQLSSQWTDFDDT